MPVTEPWSKEMNAILLARFREGVPTDKIAEEIGVTRAAVQCRARRLGLKRERTYTHTTHKIGKDGHRAFTPRCAEILRQHGWDI